jgi:Holliday junction resolvase RusA-like endonuclease
MKKQIIYGNTPSKSNCYRIGGEMLYKTPALKKYENSFFMQLSGDLRNKLITGYFEIHIDVYYPSGRADLDNSLKIVLDCLQKAQAIKNDNKCCKIVAQRFIDKKEPRIEFFLKEIDI